MKTTGKIILGALSIILLCWLGLNLFYVPKYYTDNKSDRWITISSDNNMKEKIINYVDSANEQDGKFIVPDKWLSLMSEVDSSGSTFDHKVIYFSEAPEEMYFVEFTPMPNVRAIYNPQLSRHHWIWGTKKISVSDQNRIVVRFKSEIITPGSVPFITFENGKK
ncbi:MAG: hypothetical protein EAY81_11545 [Bacteroidetes bacterium]|nr:MAG: hypothetical protein EAY81_11545 [Bacteroidota bacterium]